MFNPVSTYRIQFHKEFTFDALGQVISYLKKLGIKTIYASPVFKAVPGSNHGYDVVNPLEINPEVGSAAQLTSISSQLKNENMGWLQDIVPNHMAFHWANEWLMDVLEKGQQSCFNGFFDIDWQNRACDGKLMVPFLGAPLNEVIRNNELKIVYENNRFVFNYFNASYPLHAPSYITILEACIENLPSSIRQLSEQIKQITNTNDPAIYSTHWEELLVQLHSIKKDDEAGKYIDGCLSKINADKDFIQKIAEEQFYYLSQWQEAGRFITYRRFFTVNGLICLNIQNEYVFEQYHQLIKSLSEQGIFQALRIDHIDGLYDPTSYLQKLRALTGDRAYITVEKILQSGEALPYQWPVEGTTGYDFLSLVNNLFTNKKNENYFTNFYQELTANYNSPYEQLLEKKFLFLYRYMNGELENLYQLLLSLTDKKLLSSIYPSYLKEAIGEFLIHCPVYRYYGNKFPLDADEAGAVENIIYNIEHNGKVKPQVATILRTILLQKPTEGNEQFNTRLLHFYKRCMQFTGPLMAKGVEDTFMYTYNRFIGHNEVGDSPLFFGITKDDFHKAIAARQRQWPLSQNTTSTHDTKRGEDVRARLNVLTDLPDEWLELVQQWQQMNVGYKQNNFPDSNDEYFVYQVLIGSYPMPGDDEGNYSNRLQEYLQKALREGKINSDWASPDDVYEMATKNFATSLLNKDHSFWQSFSLFHHRIAEAGIINSLSQLLLKFTCPGTADVYQGCELWDLSFVDPDNRGVVDYDLRSKLLDELCYDKDKDSFIQELWEKRYTGKIKLWLTHSLLDLRKEQTDFFGKATYVPLQIKGTYSENAFAFARQYKQQWLIVAVALHTAALSRQQGKDILYLDWKDTAVVLPKQLTGKAANILTGNETDIQKDFSLQQLFAKLPFALVKMESEANERNAGVLLHISSLPSRFGIGDLGPEAYCFADTLSNCNQKVWQMLPLNPVDPGQGYSPYSSISSRAGNILFISPELLVKDGLLAAKDLGQFDLVQESQIDFTGTINMRDKIFNKVWATAKRNKKISLYKQFKEFSSRESGWLDDFALYTVIKMQEDGKAWFQWPEDLKKRNTEALQKISKEQKDAIEKTKFLQFIFSKQWQELKAYCNNKDIQLLGDLPIYISYDSVDVWSNPEIFNIDERGDLQGVAGTPPDAFSNEGQLWGMPVFNWEVLKESNYSWWIKRLKKNKELFDIIRLDHFRAFAAYWEVPALDSTAKNGSWKPGPGADFFERIKNELGNLHFVAEDLGDIDDDVRSLRDQFKLPGMKVLHFAFDENMPASEYIPHNYNYNFFVYTGTHDNNTTRGWYRQDINDNTRNRIAQYCGKDISEGNIAYELMKLAYASVAKTVIIPLQDILNLDENARMNIPSSGANNWRWKLLPGNFTEEAQNRLKECTWLYNRN